jgi:hypothetical protein
MVIDPDFWSVSSERAKDRRKASNTASNSYQEVGIIRDSCPNFNLQRGNIRKGTKVLVRQNWDWWDGVEEYGQTYVVKPNIGRLTAYIAN